MKKFIQTMGWVILTVLAVDFGCFLGWIFSGQIPVSNVYFGMITANIIKLFF